MIIWNKRSAQFAAHTAEVMSDRIANDPEEYTSWDYMPVSKIRQLGATKTALVVTGDEIDKYRAEHLLEAVIYQSVANWVPNSSQRLISRAAWALGFRDWPKHQVDDCGPDKDSHDIHPMQFSTLPLEWCWTCRRIYM